MLFNQTLDLPSHKSANLLKIILNSFIHVANTERNITRKVQASCYNKYTVHACSGNIGITACTTGTLITNVHDFFRLSKMFV